MITAKDLSEEQKERIRALAAQGATLGEIQRQLAEEYGLKMTYLDARMLIGDLGIAIAEPEKEKKPEETPEEPAEAEGGSEAPVAGGVALTRGKVTLPGMLVSGRVTFSDGESAEWYVDQMGRLGLDPEKDGYRPSEADVIAFQDQLQKLAEKEGI